MSITKDDKEVWDYLGTYSSEFLFAMMNFFFMALVVRLGEAIIPERNLTEEEDYHGKNR